jgi:glutathione S-transferase
MIVVRGTHGCENTPRLLFALEELQLPYTLERAEDGEFTRAFGSPGPLLTDGDVRVLEMGASLRYVARAYGLWPAAAARQVEIDRWIEVQHRRLGPALRAASPETARLLGLLDAFLDGREWLAGDFSIAECSWSQYAVPKARAKLPLEAAPRVAAWLDRIAARPAFARALAASP